MTEPVLPVRFPDGGNVSIEFTVDAPDDDQPRLGAWLELRPDDPAAVMRAVLDNSLTKVTHPGHEHYFMAPGGQEFTVRRDRMTPPVQYVRGPTWRPLHRPADICRAGDEFSSCVEERELGAGLPRSSR
jgi:hypothetical protein